VRAHLGESVDSPKGCTPFGKSHLGPKVDEQPSVASLHGEGACRLERLATYIKQGRKPFGRKERNQVE
jgi:hypothetical protein